MPIYAVFHEEFDFPIKNANFGYNLFSYMYTHTIYAVFHEESNFPVENAQFWQLDVKNEEKRNECNLFFSMFLVFWT